MTLYLTGYNGLTRTREQLEQWSHWQKLDPELQRRTMALLDASVTAGRPLGIGSVFRSDDQADALFLSRHHQVLIGGCCVFRKDGKRYALNPGAAHAAQGGDTYHGPTTPAGFALAIDFIGDLAFLKERAAAYGFVEFSLVNREPWHGQPWELPKSRTRYVATTMHPLHTFTLPVPPSAGPLVVKAPAPTLKQRIGLLAGKNAPGETRALQLQLNFWGWRDAMNRTLIVDDDFGAKTAQAVIAMQRTLGQTQDGVYGPRSAAALQAHLTAMAGMVR